MCESRFVDLFMHDGSDGAGESLAPASPCFKTEFRKQRKAYLCSYSWNPLDKFRPLYKTYSASSMVSNHQWTGGTNQYSLAVFFTCFKLTLSSDDN